MIPDLIPFTPVWLTHQIGLANCRYSIGRLVIWPVLVFFILGSMVNCGGSSSGDGDGGEGSSSPVLYETVKLTASDAAADDRFGKAVSVSGDLVGVGAWGEDSEGDEAGAAYVFYRNEGGADAWGEVTKLTASDGETNDSFGEAVSVSGDVAVVGAWGEDAEGSYAGAAYIYYRNESGDDAWGEVAKVTASDAAAFDQYGVSVSISGDYAVVGANCEGFYAGAAYVYSGSDGSEVAKLTASDAETHDHFGGAVSVSGDYVLVGATGEATGGTNAGAAYVFYRNEGGANAWGEVTKLTASDAAADDRFGAAVSVSGDLAIVGAWGEDAGGEDAGAAYVFYRNEGGADAWGEVAKLTASDAAAFNGFGADVSISGDYAVVGASGGDGEEVGTGAAYVFYRNEGGADAWGEVAKLAASDGEANDYFGAVVSLSGTTAVVGAWGESAGGNRAGAAYVFEW